MKTIAEISLKIGVAAFLMLTFVLLILTKTELVKGFHTYAVLTGSMQPTIPTGSIVFAKQQQTYGKGDIVAFRNTGITITHRVHDVEKTGVDTHLITKGDANNSVDDVKVSPSNVTGRIIFHLPYLGSLVLFLRTLPGFVITVIVPAFLFIGFEMYSIVGELQKNQQRKSTLYDLLAGS